MAVVVPANQAPDTLPRIRGVVLCRPWRGIWVAAKWPRKRGGYQSWAQYFTSQQFAIASRMAANSEPRQFETARFLTEGSHWLPRDLLVRAAYGTAYEVYLPDGTQATVADHGAPQAAPPEPVWTDAATAVLDTNSHGWNGYTIRQRIEWSALSHFGPQWRFTFNASLATAGMTIAKAYFGNAAATGSAYDFATTPLPLSFAGAAGVAIPQGDTAISDPITISLVEGQPLLISYLLAGTSSIRVKNANTGWQGYYRFGDFANVVDATGFTTSGAALGVSRVETLTAP